MRGLGYSDVVGRWVWDPAASDVELREACADLRAGRWAAADEVLRATTTDPGLRASRSLLLGAVAATSDTAETWVREHPGSAEARLVFARVAAARALRAANAGQRTTAGLLTVGALEACDAARELEVAQNDATPFVIMLSVAHLVQDGDQWPASNSVDLHGPWPWWDEAMRRDPVGREAHHRMLHHFSASGSGTRGRMWTFARWAADQAPTGSPAVLMPVAARAEHYRAVRDQEFSYQQWTSQDAKRQLNTAYEQWFARVGGMTHVPVADLSLLAYGLSHAFARGDTRTRDVLASMVPYGHRWPWSIDGDPAQQLDWAVERHGLKPP